MKRLVALIDGDISAYRAAASTQKSIDWGDGDEPSIWANPKEAIKVAIETTRMWIEAANVDPKRSLVCLTGNGNFRKTVLPTYKANRSNVVRPVALKAVREALQDTFTCAIVDGLEADDLIGLMLTAPRSKGKCVAVTIDKDLRTVPGLHLNPFKAAAGPVSVSASQADLAWMSQTLMGDACDGYKGCPGVGPKRIEKILREDLTLDDMWRNVAEMFLAKGLTEDDAIQQARVARILRHPDYNKATREVTLWHPREPEVLKMDVKEAA